MFSAVKDIVMLYWKKVVAASVWQKNMKKSKKCCFKPYFIKQNRKHVSVIDLYRVVMILAVSKTKKEDAREDASNAVCGQNAELGVRTRVKNDDEK